MQDEPRNSRRLTPAFPGRVDDVGLDGEIVADEFGRIFVVGVDAADLGGGEEDVVGLLLLEEGVHLCLIGQIQFGMGASEQVGVTLRREVAHQGGTHQAAVARHVYAGGVFHAHS